MKRTAHNRGKYKHKVGDILTNLSGERFEILERTPSEGKKKATVTVRFLETGFVSTVTSSQVSKLEIRDWSKPSVYGVGYYSSNDVVRCVYNGTQKTNSPAYEVWLGMLKRCYKEGSRSYRDYGGAGVTVCDEWHDFVKFESWFNSNHSPDMVLDKDILSGGFRGKCYSPTNCTVVPNCVNAFFTNSRRKRGLFPVGVYRKDAKLAGTRYIAQVGNLDDRQEYLGRFDTMHEAFMAYKAAREGLAKTLAEREYTKGTISEDVYNRILGWKAVPYP